MRQRMCTMNITFLYVQINTSGFIGYWILPSDREQHGLTVALNVG